MRRFRESNLSCDHLRECLNELLGVGPGERETPRVFGNFYRRDILYGNAGPTGIRGEPKPHGGGYRRGKEEDLSPSSSLSLFLLLFLSGGGETMARVDLPPSWFIAQSAFTANGFVFAEADACVPTTRIDQHLHLVSLSPLRRLSHLAALLSICDFFLTFYASRDVSAVFRSRNRVSNYNELITQK